jgi:gliding motility-associated-like protein
LNYSLNGGSVQTSNIFSGLISGNYSIIVSDVNGCSVSTSEVNIANPSLLVASANGTSQVSCFGSMDGEITVEYQGGTGAISFSLNGGLGQSLNVFSGLQSGSYTVVVSDENGCSTSTSAVTISSPQILVASSQASSQVSCHDASDGELTVLVSGGNGNYMFSLNGGVAQASNLFSDLSAGSYVVLVTDANGCSYTTSTSIIDNPQMLTVTAHASLQVSCNNSSDGTIVVTALGGTGYYSYSLNGSAFQTSNTFTGLSSGNYILEVIDENGCSASLQAPLFIANPSRFSATGYVTTPISCNNMSDATITVTANGGTSPYSYSLNGGGVQTSNIFAGLSAGTYTIIVYDQMNCQFTIPVIVVSNPALVVADLSGSNQVSCNDLSDGEVIVNAQGGTGNYNYSLNGGNSQSSNVFNNLTAGSYSVVVSDANSCTAVTNMVEILNPTVLEISVQGSTQVSCAGGMDGQINVQAQGGTGSYSYSLNGGIAQTSDIFSGLSSGNYIITVMDENNCTAISSEIVIANPSNLTANVNASEQVLCHDSNDGQIVVTAQGGTGTLSYSINGGVSQLSNVFESLTSGQYSIVVIDANGCYIEMPAVSIANPDGIIADVQASAQVSCFNNSDGQIIVNAAGGSGNLNYALNGGISQVSNMFENLSSGSYTVMVNDENGCSVEVPSVVIANPESITLTADVNNQASCFASMDGQVTVNALGGTGSYSYYINGGMAQTSNVFDGLSAGIYSIVVIDENGCESTIETEVISPQPIVVDYSNNCRTGEVGIEITANGGVAPYQYSIDGGQTYMTTNIFDNLTIGTVISVYVEDANGCFSQVIPVSVASLNTLEAEALITTENLCYNVSDAVVEVVAHGGFSPYTYSLNGGTAVAESTLTDLPAGDHNIIVRDVHGCPASVDFEITPQQPVLINIESLTQADCLYKTYGSAEISVEGGVSPYNVSWSNGETSLQAVNLTPGDHTITVTDMNNCKTTQSISIGFEEITVVPEMNNAFSPNGDGYNDYWVIKNLEIFPENELVIINRWGNEVLTVNGYQNNWDGSGLGEGTYFYMLKVKMCGGENTYSGYVTILR